MRMKPLYLQGSEASCMFASRSHHTEHAKRCKAEKCVKRLFFPCFFHFLVRDAPCRAEEKVRAKQTAGAPPQVDW